MSIVARFQRLTDLSSQDQDFWDRWEAAIKEAARASFYGSMVTEACERGEANLEELVRAKDRKARADETLRTVGREYRQRSAQRQA